MAGIDFNKVVAYSRSVCHTQSIGECATFVKRAFEKGGCKYISGNGWNNQKWCKANNFELIGDFVPVDRNPRAHDGKPIQFPPGYVQQVGDVCLIKHGTYGHICYAMGSGINDWVSDYYQRPPAQQAGTGPYCYTGDYERVQFWRHKTVMNGAPSVQESMQSMYADNVTEPDTRRTGYSSSNGWTSNISGVSNNVMRLSSVSRENDNVLKQDDARKGEFESMVNAMASAAPKMGRDIIITSEMYDANILKGSQESRKERV